jgi:hypothetical protein
MVAASGVFASGTVEKGAFSTTEFAAGTDVTNRTSLL